MVSSFQKLKNLINGKQNILNITTGVEFETGRTIDGKKEYGLYKNLGTLSDIENKSKIFKTGISDSYKVIKYQLFAKNKTNGQLLTIPFINLTNTQFLSAYLNSPNDLIARSNYDFYEYDLVIDISYIKN